MPKVANQLPNAMQTSSLSTERQSSSIPKGGSQDESSTWTYPSPQMFYNSLIRKGKLDPEVCGEEDVQSVVMLHNNMNEKTWAKVMEWEELLVGSGNGSKLSRFMGRPMDLSPKSRVKNLFFGHPLPFDRHDWTVVREDGTEVRYVIDYYHDDIAASEFKQSAYPSLHDRGAVKSILVDVRPALDSVGVALARTVTMPLARISGESKFAPLPMMPSAQLKNQVAEADRVWKNIQANAKGENPQLHSSDKQPNVPKRSITKDEASEFSKNLVKILNECNKTQQKLSNCSSEDECSKLTLEFTLCMANVACPIQHDAVLRSLHADETDEATYDARVDASIENASTCVNNFYGLVSEAKVQYPDMFEKK